jgi:hypothetical protein
MEAKWRLNGVQWRINGVQWRINEANLEVPDAVRDSPPARGSVERSACTRDIVHETRVVDDERICLLVSSILFEPGEHASLCIAPVVALQSLLDCSRQAFGEAKPAGS